MRRLVATAVLAATLLFVSGCSSIARWEYQHARKLQEGNNFQSALSLYTRVLSAIPDRDRHWRSDVYMRIGECFWALGQAADGFKAFQSAAESDPSNTPAQLRVGQLYLEAGSADRATEYAQEALRSASGNPEAMALLGSAAEAVGQEQIAEAAYSNALKADPQRVRVAILLADLYNRQDRTDDARRVLRSASESAPGSSLPQIALGRLEEQEGNNSAAETSYRRAVTLEDTPDNNLHFAQFLQRNSRIDEAEKILTHSDSLRLRELPTDLADFEFTAGRTMHALEAYENAIRLGGNLHQDSFKWYRPSTWSTNPDSVPDARIPELAARIVEADLQVASRQQDPSDAASALSITRMHLDEYRNQLDAATIAVLNAEIALAENDVSLAAVHSATAVTLAPDSASARYLAGVVKYRSGDKEGARQEWLQSFQDDSSFVPARLGLTLRALESHDIPGAEQYIVSVVRNEPANLHALNLFAHVLLTGEHYDSAAMIAHRAAVVDKTSAWPQLLLGEIAERQHDYGNALLAFERAVTIDPHSLAGMQGMIRIYRRARVTQRVLRKMEAVAEVKPPSPTLMEIAGRLYAEHAWYSDAERCLRKSLSIDPRRATAAEALANAELASGNVAQAAKSATQAGGWSASLLSASLAERNHDLPGAIRNYENALRQGENTGIAANNLAWLYAGGANEEQIGTSPSDLDRALKLAQRARDLAPQSAAVLDTLGFVLLQRRAYTQAIGVLQSAVVMAQGESETIKGAALARTIRLHLAEAYLRSGSTEQAELLQ